MIQLNNIHDNININIDLFNKIYNSIIKHSYKYKNDIRYIKLKYNDNYNYYTFNKKQLFEFIKYIICPYTLTKKYINSYNILYNNENIINDNNIIKKHKNNINDYYTKLLNKKYQKNIYDNKIKNFLSDPITYINTDYNIFYIMSLIFIKNNNISLV